LIAFNKSVSFLKKYEKTGECKNKYDIEYIADVNDISG
jgi:hypothetical protein